ncbi:MAG: hypothetical protein JST65_15770 [Acidobacteria bacterium]|nr:hypothetical protein [Acidobacteriota bacterium]
MSDDTTSDVNPGYASHQLAKALTSCAAGGSEERVRQWKAVFEGILSGSIAYGLRNPIADVPVWATPEVVTGGFATGRLLASPRDGAEDVAGRNASFLTSSGLAELRQMLSDGCFDVEVPEEGALLTVAWLAENGRAEEARALLDQIAPYFARLRFYPVPRAEPHREGTSVHLQTTGETARALAAIPPNDRILAQQESVRIWAPFHDRVVALFLETVEDTWPCRRFPDGWSSRAKSLLDEYAALREVHRRCRKMDRPNLHYRQLRELLGKCADDPASLSGNEVGRIRLILSRYQQKRGAPGSEACEAARARQCRDVAAPTHQAIAAAVATRFALLRPDEGVEDIEPLCAPVEGANVPAAIKRRIERCAQDTVEALVARGLITSGDTLAAVLPQVTSGARAAGFADPELQRLYGTVYRAFRRRRSLLLLHLEKQVQIEELPWVRAIEPLRQKTLGEREQAAKVLREITTLALTSFPQAIVPNKLLQEMRALAKGAGLDLPLVEEVAADIFMGEFSDKFVEAAKRAAGVLTGTLYARYYGIDYAEILALQPRRSEPRGNGFAAICVRRAGIVADGRWDTVANGMVIEQQQILTSQNLAVLCDGIDELRGRYPAMSRRCFEWVVRRQQLRTPDRHAVLIGLKNSAYAWRQMLFYLSFVTPGEMDAFTEWATALLSRQPEAFQERFRPALAGLTNGRRQFLGWTKERHGLLNSR